MKRLLLALALIAVRAEALDDAAAKRFFNATGCNGCHAVDEQRIGPRFRDVANRYRAEGEAATARLAAKIRSGGAGNWGLVPMVGNPKLTTEQARAIATWIVALPEKP
ncbi:MAG: c-type cytochrome [Gammaproteobacteria bacterium]|nr:c-type cytochrome [Gammaproteobacteria bacterium]MBI5615164.1 c-type cytochrome [Gammaproteobacteria bacterium]